MDNMLTNENKSNFFYEVILKNIINDSKEGTLHKSLHEIHVNGFKNLTPVHFTTLGNLSYFIGLDFFQQESLQFPIVEKFRARFKMLELTDKDIAMFFNILKQINVSEFNAPYEQLKVLISTPIPNAVQDIVLLRKKVNYVIRNSSFSVNYAEDIEEILNTTHYTYHQILKINNIFNETLNLNGSCIGRVVEIYSSELWMELLKKATYIYDVQKFAVVYLDSINSAKETFQKFPGYDRLLDSVYFQDWSSKIPVDVDNSDDQVVIPTGAEEEIQKRTQEEISEIAEKNSDETFMGLLIELNDNKPIETEEEFMGCVKALILNEELSKDVYKYLVGMKNTNRNMFALDGTPIYGNFDLVKLRKLIVSEIETQSEKYKKLVIILTEVIPEDKINRIVLYVNETIKSLQIIGSKRKNYLISQVAENQISTYHHLQQIISLIEECDIFGDKTENYTILTKYLKEHTNVVEIFEESLKVDSIQFEISFLKGVGNFLFVEPVKLDNTMSSPEIPVDTDTEELKTEGERQY